MITAGGHNRHGVPKRRRDVRIGDIPTFDRVIVVAAVDCHVVAADFNRVIAAARIENDGTFSDVSFVVAFGAGAERFVVVNDVHHFKFSSAFERNGAGRANFNDDGVVAASSSEVLCYVQSGGFIGASDVRVAVGMNDDSDVWGFGKGYVVVAGAADHCSVSSAFEQACVVIAVAQIEVVRGAHSCNSIIAGAENGGLAGHVRHQRVVAVAGDDCAARPVADDAVITFSCSDEGVLALNVEKFVAGGVSGQNGAICRRAIDVDTVVAVEGQEY